MRPLLPQKQSSRLPPPMARQEEKLYLAEMHGPSPTDLWRPSHFCSHRARSLSTGSQSSQSSKAWWVLPRLHIWPVTRATIRHRRDRVRQSPSRPGHSHQHYASLGQSYPWNRRGPWHRCGPPVHTWDAAPRGRKILRDRESIPTSLYLWQRQPALRPLPRLSRWMINRSSTLHSRGSWPRRWRRPTHSGNPFHLLTRSSPLYQSGWHRHFLICGPPRRRNQISAARSEEHTSELQSR